MMTDNIKKAQERRMGIYIHVPFCRSKCHYCDFCSQSNKDEEQKQKYVESLCGEIRFIADKIKDSGKPQPIADTVYFGGGTPTLLNPEQLESVLTTVSENFGICKDCEITAEANPASADRQKLSDMRRLGINRLSIGMQSVHDGELKLLGRIHSFEDFKNMYADARRSGFDNISADLMYGIPCQTAESFETSVRTLAEMSPEHISSYCLTIEQGTNFYRRRDSLALPDEDTVADMYASMTDILKKYGYEKYEISNFAHKGRESKHNIKYWKVDDYLGFGSAAHSCFDGVRFAHSRDIEAYIRGENTYCEVKKTGHNEAANEYVMLGMRLRDGVDIDQFNSRFGIDFYEHFGQKFAKYTPDFVLIGGDKCAFTEKGMLVSNFILSDVLDFD